MTRLAHTLAISREDRAIFNAAVDAILDEISVLPGRVGAKPAADPKHFRALERLARFGRRRACKRAIDEYHQARRGETRDGAHGPENHLDLPRLEAAAATLRKFLRHR